MLACAITVLPAAQALPGNPNASDPVERRLLDESELAGLVGAGGGPPAIGFGSNVTGSVGDNQTAAYSFSSGNDATATNLGIYATFRVEDTTANIGTYRLEIRKATDNSLVHTADGVTDGEPTIIQDALLPENTAFVVNVIELTGAGPFPRPYRLRVSPRYTAPGSSVSFGSANPATLSGGDFDTFRLTVGAQTGLADLYLTDNGITLGNNSVTVIAADRVTTLATVSATNHVSVDASEQPNFSFSEPGEYLIVVTNSDIGASGSYRLDVGREPKPCQVVTAPSAGSPIAIPPPNDEDDIGLSPRIAFVGDRDCFEFTTAAGVAKMTIGFDQTNGSTTKNEVRLFKAGEQIGGKVNGGDFNYSPDINTPDPATYKIEVNNRVDGQPIYAMTVDVGASCFGESCSLTPTSPVNNVLNAGNMVDTYTIFENAGPPPVSFANPGAASFFLDRSGTGSRTLEILADLGSGQETVCSGGPTNSDIFIENCDLTRAVGEPQLRVTLGSSSNSGAYTASMSDDLIALCSSPAPILPGSLVSGSLEKFGEEDVYSFTLDATAQIGLGFHDDGIGSSSTNVVKLIAQADCDAFMKDPGFPGLLTCTGTADCGAAAISLDAGTYYVIVDNDKNGTGSYDVCAGPGTNAFDKDQNGQSTIPTLTAPPPAIGLTFTDGLNCGDTDTWLLTSTIAQQVVIEAKEVSSPFPGNISLQVPALAASDSGRDTAKVTVSLAANVTYQVVVDNASYGAGNYLLTIKPPA